VSLPQKDEGKIRLINKLINQFVSSIKHKPFESEMDRARTLGFIHALRNVITDNGRKSLPRRLDYAPPLSYVEPTAETKALNKREIEKIKNRLKKRNANEVDGQD